MTLKVETKGNRVVLTSGGKVRLLDTASTCCGCPATVLVDMSAISDTLNATCPGLFSCSTGLKLITLTMGSQCDYTATACLSIIDAAFLETSYTTDFHLYYYSPGSTWQLDIIIHVGGVGGTVTASWISGTHSACNPTDLATGAHLFTNLGGSCIINDITVYNDPASNCYCAGPCGCCNLVIDTVTNGVDGSGCGIDTCNPDGSGGEEITPILLTRIDTCSFGNGNVWCVGGVRVNGLLNWNGSNWVLTLTEAADSGHVVGVYTGGTDVDDPTGNYSETTGCFTGGDIIISTCCLPASITLDTSAVDLSCLSGFGLPNCDNDSIPSPFVVYLVTGCPPSSFPYNTGVFSPPYNPYCVNGKKVGVNFQYSNAGFGNQWILTMTFNTDLVAAVWGGPTTKCDPTGTYSVLPSGYCTTGDIVVS